MQANFCIAHMQSHFLFTFVPKNKNVSKRNANYCLHLIADMNLIFLFLGVPYQLDKLVCNQPRLSAFFSMKKGPTLEKPTMCKTIEKKYEAEDSLPLVAVKLKDTNSSKVSESIECRPQMYSESEINLPENADAELNEKPSDDIGAAELKDTNLSDVDDSIECKPRVRDSFKMLLLKEAGVEVKKPSIEKINYAEEAEPGIIDSGHSSEGNVSNLHDFSALIHNSCTNSFHSDGSSSSMVGGSSKMRHSTLENPDFVENYFKVL